jgi:hypothetical protein
VTAGDAARDKVLDHLLREGSRLRSTYGVRVSPLVYSLAGARHRWSRRLPPLPETVRDGIVLVGPPLGDLLAGG